jgi:transcriptional regulator with XRE-family HTH domain
MNGIDMALHEHFVANVRRRRLELGLTQRELAEKLNASTPYVSQVEAGKMVPSLGVVERFAKALKCSSITLLVAPDEAEVPA